MIRRRKPPSQTWRTFLKNHVGDIAAVDFFTVPTATFRILFCFLVLLHDRRRVVHFNVTANPSATWTAQQVIEAFPFDGAPRFLLRDRDSVYDELFRRRVRGMGMEEVVIAPQAPWQNPYVERLIGSIRRDCLDHVIILGESHLRKILSRYFAYYPRTVFICCWSETRRTSARLSRDPQARSHRNPASAGSTTDTAELPEELASAQPFLGGDALPRGARCEWKPLNSATISYTTRAGTALLFRGFTAGT